MFPRYITSYPNSHIDPWYYYNNPTAVLPRYITTIVPTAILAHGITITIKQLCFPDILLVIPTAILTHGITICY